MFETNVKKCNTRNLRSNVYAQQWHPGFDQSKLFSKPIFSSGSKIDEDSDQSLIPIQEDQQARNYKDRIFVRKATGNRRKKGHEGIEHYVNIKQLYLDNCKIPKTSKSETTSMTYLPVHLYAYEKNELSENLDNLPEDFTEERKIVLFETTSIEKNEVVTFSSANHLPTTERPLLLTSNYFKQKEYLRYFIRDYSQDSKVLTPTAVQVDEEIAKKHQCLPPLGPPPILQPPPPKRPPLPCCPKKREKKKKFCALDKGCLLINRQKRFVGCHQSENQNLATWRALSARGSKRVVDKRTKGYTIEPPLSDV